MIDAKKEFKKLIDGKTSRLSIVIEKKSEYSRMVIMNFTAALTLLSVSYFDTSMFSSNIFILCSVYLLFSMTWMFKEYLALKLFQEHLFDDLLSTLANWKKEHGDE